MAATRQPRKPRKPARKPAAKPAVRARPPHGGAPPTDTPAPKVKAEILAKVRDLCLSFPGANERPSHGSPCFFIQDKRSFLSMVDNHHHDGRFALWCAAPDGMQRMLVDSAPDHYFVPPYVGPQGWVGVRLDRSATWDEIASVIENAYLAKAPEKLVAQWRATPAAPSRGAKSRAR
jgi:hypothetical protein